MKVEAKFLSVIFLVFMIAIPVTAVRTGSDMGMGTRADYSRDQARVHFNVTYPNGSPAGGIMIEIIAYHSFSGSPAKGTTNSSGMALVNVTYYNWGPCTIVLYDMTKEHFLALERLIAPNDRIFYDLMLPEHLPYDNVVKGTVRKLDTMASASGVKVQITGHDQMGRYVEESVYTDGSGSYTLNVPDTHDGYMLSVIEPSPGYDPSSVSMFPDPDRAENLFDLYIRPELTASVPFSFRVLNPATMEPMEGMTAMARGNPIGTDLAYTYRTFSYDSVSKKFDTLLFPGEYSLSWNGPKHPYWNVSYGLETYILLNSTPLDIDITLDVPTEMRLVRLRAWSSAGEPVGYCQLQYYHTIYEGDMRSSIILYGTAAPDGWISFGIPPDTDVNVRAWYWGYHDKELTIPSGPASSPVELNITLQEGDPYLVPQGDFSFFVKDKVTGVPLPGASFYGVTWDEEGMVYSISGNSAYNGFANGSGDAARYPEIKVNHPLGTAVMRNVTIVQGMRTDLTVELDRRTYPEARYTYSIDLKDPQGQPLPSVSVILSSNDLGVDFTATSDRSGRVSFKARPSNYHIEPEQSISYWYRKAQWAGEAELIAPPGGGHLGSLTLYPTRPITAIEGHVIDSSTMRPLKFRRVTASSFHESAGTSRQMGPYYPWMEKMFMRDDDGIKLFYSYHHSDRTGFYKAYGRESVTLSCWSEGYFEYKEKVDLGTRASLQKDILLDPVPEPTSLLQGNLVNEDGAPVRGMVLLFETGHPNALFKENFTWTDGSFSFELHPAQYRIVFGNETLHSETTVTVNESGLTGLVLELIPYSYLNGTVQDAQGAPIEGIQLSLLRTGSPGNVLVENRTSDPNGRFSFKLGKGTYMVEFPGSDRYLPSSSEAITLTGWNKVGILMVLFERTSGTLKGRVLGDGGPLNGGIEGATVWLNDALYGPIMSAITGEMGQYEMVDVPYGVGYTLNATPPSDILGEPLVRSGYLPSAPRTLDIRRMVTVEDLSLSYYMLPAAGYFNITHYGPTGIGVLLDEPIRITFSEAMGKEDFPSFLEISPAPSDLRLSWDLDGTSVRIDHGPFEPNTTYTVKVDRYIVSANGNWLWGGEDLVWNFTTGFEQGAWALGGKTVVVGSDRTTYINATGRADQSVYVVISGLGSYKMNETGAGTYNVVIPPTDLSWDTEYTYHFSDRAGGPDMVPELGGKFKTPKAPPIGPPIGDDDDDDDDGIGRYILPLCIVLGIVILLIILVLVLVLALRKKESPEQWEGEE